MRLCLAVKSRIRWRNNCIRLLDGQEGFQDLLRATQWDPNFLGLQYYKFFMIYRLIGHLFLALQYLSVRTLVLQVSFLFLGVHNIAHLALQCISVRITCKFMGQFAFASFPFSFYHCRNQKLFFGSFLCFYSAFWILSHNLK